MDVFDQPQIPTPDERPPVNVARISILYFGVIVLVSLIGFGVYVWLFSGGDAPVSSSPAFVGVRVFEVPGGPTLSPEEMRALEDAARIQQQLADMGDPDGDGLTNEREAEVGTNPNLLDTDGDGVDDFVEVTITGGDPLNGDTDGDGIGDREDEIDNRPQL